MKITDSEILFAHVFRELPIFETAYILKVSIDRVREVLINAETMHAETIEKLRRWKHTGCFWKEPRPVYFGHRSEEYGEQIYTHRTFKQAADEMK